MRSLIARVVETEDELGKRCSPEHRPVTNAARVFCGGSRVRPFLAAGAAIFLAGLAIVRLRPGATGEIYVMYAEGSEPTRLTHDQSVSVPCGLPTA
jgi:hypothetical protein